MTYEEQFRYANSGEFRNYTPFLVYAADAPEYWGTLFTSYDVRTGWRRQPGSAIVITGGYYKPDESSMFVTGIINEDDYLGVGKRFTESAVAALVDPRDRVFYRGGFSQEQSKVCIAASEAGFDATLVYSASGYADDTIAVGTGEMLPRFRWLEHAEDASGTLLIASCEPPGRLEKALCTAAVHKGSTYKIMSDIWSSREPETYRRMLGAFNVVAGMTGPDCASIGIERRDTEIRHLQGIFSDIASELSVPLYYAGSIGTLDQAGDSFGDFPFYLGWSPIPEHWKRLV